MKIPLLREAKQVQFSCSIPGAHSSQGVISRGKLGGSLELLPTPGPDTELESLILMQPWTGTVHEVAMLPMKAQGDPLGEIYGIF